MHVAVRVAAPGSARRGSAGWACANDLRPRRPGLRASPTRRSPAPSRSCARCRSRSGGRGRSGRPLLAREVVPAVGDRAADAAVAERERDQQDHQRHRRQRRRARRSRSGGARARTAAPTRARRSISMPATVQAPTITSRISPNSTPASSRSASAMRSSVSALWRERPGGHSAGPPRRAAARPATAAAAARAEPERDADQPATGCSRARSSAAS